MARSFILSVVLVLSTVGVGAAQQLPESLCDPQYQDCRAPLLDLIRQEPVGGGIDVAFWYMTDARYSQALSDAHRRGVPIRVLIDTNAVTSGHNQTAVVDALRVAGIPIRDKFVNGNLLHFKMMLFEGQNIVQFSKANYEPSAFKFIQAYVDYHDEAIFFTNDRNITDSFRYRFDDLWTNTTVYRDFANVNGPLVRRYPDAMIHPSMNFSPLEDFVNRLVGRFNRETQGIDAIAFRITDNRASDAMLNARSRGIPVRLITDLREYRNGKSVWHSKHIDKFWYAGVQVKENQHAGYMHQGSVVLRGLGEVIFGSSNWTIASANQQDEHNYFYTPALNKFWFFQWFADQFTNKWEDSANYRVFQPLPPGKPTNISPQNVASGVGSTVTLTWDGGNWAHLYDIYFGPNPNPPLIAENKQLGSPVTGTRETFTATNLLPGTTYYWRVVGKTWAYLTNNGPTWSFTTAGAPPAGNTGTPIPGTVQAEDFDTGGQNVAYNDTTSTNSGNAYRPTEGVDIGPTGDPGNANYYVGWTRVGEWLKYTIDATEARSYALTVRVANVGTGAKFRVEVDGTPVAERALPNTGGWDSWQDVLISPVSLSQGTHVVRLIMVAPNTGASGVGNYGYLKFD
jgi:Carbohydrate binding module (family 6)/PLD-like domain